MWLEAGDRNSKFFHATTSARRQRNSVFQLKNSLGDWINWDNGLDSLMINYFTDLFTSSNIEWSKIVPLIEARVSESQNTEFLRPVLTEEVRLAIFQMHPDSSPGDDGMTPGFFSKILVYSAE